MDFIIFVLAGTLVTCTLSLVLAAPLYPITRLTLGPEKGYDAWYWLLEKLGSFIGFLLVASLFIMATVIYLDGNYDTWFNALWRSIEVYSQGAQMVARFAVETVWGWLFENCQEWGAADTRRVLCSQHQQSSPPL